MPFVLKVRTDLSLAQLLTLLKSGYSVMKTPHVGNWYLNNLAIAALGFPMEVYDRTIGSRDTNFHPQAVIKDGQMETIARPDVLVDRARVFRDSSLASDYFKIGQQLSACHLRALKELFPQTVIQSHANYLTRHRDLILSLLANLPAEAGQLWWRKVLPSGQVIKIEGGYSHQRVMAEGIYGLHSLESGWLIPKEITALLFAIVESLISGHSDVYHLSGPDMVKYIGEKLDLISWLYDGLLARQPGLKPEVWFNLVPVADMRFAVPAYRRQQLDYLLSALESFNRVQEENGKVMRRTDLSFSEKLDKTKPRLNSAREDLHQAIRGCLEVFYRIDEGKFVSQYDLLANGRQVYIHPFGLEATPDDWRRALQQLNRQMPDKKLRLSF